MRGPPGGRPARIMIEFQRGAFRVFTGCTEFRRGAKEFLAARDSFVSRGCPSGRFDSRLLLDAVFHPRRAARNLFGLLYRRFIIVCALKGSDVNARTLARSASESTWASKLRKRPSPRGSHPLSVFDSESVPRYPRAMLTLSILFIIVSR